MRAIGGRAWPRGLIVVGLLAAAGCGRPGSLTGTVSSGGQKLAFGSVQVRGSDGVVRSAAIGPDGRYTVTGLPAGPAAVGVTCRDPREVEYTQGLGRGGRGPSPSRVAARPSRSAPNFSLIPERYSDLDRSELATTVLGGVNEFDIDLR